MEGRLL